jgi:hypothetical protein
MRTLRLFHAFQRPGWFRSIYEDNAHNTSQWRTQAFHETIVFGSLSRSAVMASLYIFLLDMTTRLFHGISGVQSISHYTLGLECLYITGALGFMV